MMNPLYRIIALLFVPCLVAEPITASARALAFECPQPPTLHCHFDQQALVSRLRYVHVIEGPVRGALSSLFKNTQPPLRTPLPNPVSVQQTGAPTRVYSAKGGTPLAALYTFPVAAFLAARGWVPMQDPAGPFALSIWATLGVGLPVIGAAIRRVAGKERPAAGEKRIKIAKGGNLDGKSLSGSSAFRDWLRERLPYEIPAELISVFVRDMGTLAQWYRFGEWLGERGRADPGDQRLHRGLFTREGNARFVVTRKGVPIRDHDNLREGDTLVVIDEPLKGRHAVFSATRFLPAALLILKLWADMHGRDVEVPGPYLSMSLAGGPPMIAFWAAGAAIMLTRRLPQGLRLASLRFQLSLRRSA